MKAIPTQLGGSRKQLITLGVLLVVLVLTYFLMRDPAPDTPTPSRAAVTSAPVAANPLTAPRPAQNVSSGPRLSTRGGRSTEDFHPSLKLKEGTDVSKIDPALKTNLLARVRNVSLEGGSRSIFDFGQAPVPVPTDVKPIHPNYGPNPPPPPQPPNVGGRPPGPPPTPPAAPIPLKFFGYGKIGGPRRALFIDGDEVQIASENDIIRNRYKVIRIGVNSVVVEDTTTHSQQTLPLLEELGS